MGQVFGGNADALILKASLDLAIVLFQSDTNLRAIKRILDCIVEEDQEEFAEESFVAGIGDFWFSSRTMEISFSRAREVTRAQASSRTSLI